MKIEKRNYVRTDWYKNTPPIMMSKGAEKEYGYDVHEFVETELYVPA